MAVIAGGSGVDPKQPSDTDPTPRSFGGDVTDPDPKVASYEPPTENARIREMFESMETRRAPAPVDAPVTNGDMSASFSTSHAAPARHLTPTAQPPVVVEEDAAAPVLTRDRLAPTIRIVRDEPTEDSPALAAGATRRTLIVGAVVGAAAMLLVVAVVASLMRSPASQGPAPVVTTKPSAMVAPLPPPAPSVVPSQFATPKAPPPQSTASVVPPAASSQPLTPRAKVPAPTRSNPKPAQPSSEDDNLME